MPRTSRDPKKGKWHVVGTYPPPDPSQLPGGGGTALSQTRTLHFMQHSMQFNDSPAQVAADVANDLSHEPDIYITSETMRHKDTLFAAANQRNYRMLSDPNVEEAFLVKRGIGLDVKSYDKVKVLSQFGRTLTPPWYPARYLSWIKIVWYDMPVWVHTMHWVAHIDDYPQFLPAHVKQTKTMGAMMRNHGETGKGISFFFGDLNWDVTYTGRFTETTRPDKIFASYGCQDIYPELDVGRPATFHDGRTLDYGVRYLRDTNVKAKRFKLWPIGNSDHRAISFWYDVDFSVLQPSSSGAGGGGTDADDLVNGVVDPDFYATGGNVSWADYRDDTAYDLVRIVEDSDRLRS